MTPNPKILYIAGYSRSGSTILDMLLGSHPKITSTGELTFLLDDACNPARRCTCGARYLDCARYGPWLRSPAGQLALNARTGLRQIEARGTLLRRHAPRLSDHASYAHHARTLFGHIAKETGASIILDSSKSARDAAHRPIALSEIAGLDVQVLHLTRDPRAVIRSYCQNGRNWVAEGHRTARPLDSFRPILGWRDANRTARELKYALGPSKYLCLRYEDLVAEPAKHLTQIGDFISLDVHDLIDMSTEKATLRAGHTVGGNRARFSQQTFHMRPHPKASIPPLHELAYRLTTRTSARRFGYS